MYPLLKVLQGLACNMPEHNLRQGSQNILSVMLGSSFV